MPQSVPLPNWLETRRLQAWELHQQGWSQRQIAAELGVTQGAVSQWLKRVREGNGGVEALRHHPAPGRRTALTSDQLQQIPMLIDRGATAFGFQGDHWTTSRVAEILKQHFGVSYHPAHISRLLRKYCPNWRDQKKG
jgi:transposase